MQIYLQPDIIILPTNHQGVKMNFIEFNTVADGTVLIKMENITLIKKNSPEYPKFVTTYGVFVNNWSWKLNEAEGEVVYSKYKEWLTSSCIK
tara:strand:- start:17 stop:292 length:276 start_codon:yes stop_codon:yes gene_type:complete